MKDEDVEQIKVIEYIRQCTDLPVFAIANQRQCSAKEGAILKRMGVTAGVSDLFLPRHNHKWKGVFIELKTLEGRLSKVQEEFLALMNKEGYCAKVCYGADEAIDLIQRFY